MRYLIFAAGILIAIAGVAAFRGTGDPSLLQGGLTLGGGFIICGIFSIKAKWHGIIGAGILALLGALRTLPKVNDEPRFFHGLAAVVCSGLLVTVVRSLLAERNRRSAEKLKSD